MYITTHILDSYWSMASEFLVMLQKHKLQKTHISILCNSKCHRQPNLTDPSQLRQIMSFTLPKRNIFLMIFQRCLHFKIFNLIVVER